MTRMHSSKNLRLMTTDLNRLQKSLKQKQDKQVQSLIQLIDLPDFDVSQFFQTLMRSNKYQQILQRIPTQKQIQFFSRNYTTFIQTQDQLSQLKLPQLQQIPKTKQFKFQDLEQKKQQQNIDQSSVLEIVDSFAAVVLEQNTSQIIRILQIINEMKQHSRYQKYFQIYAINQLYRESYENFVQTCEDKQLLLSIGQICIVLKRQLKEKMANFMTKIRTDMNVDSSIRGIKKIMEKLLSFIEVTLKQSKLQYPTQKVTNPIQIDIIIPKFLSQLSKQFYQTIQPCIYEKQQLSQILQALDIVLENSMELQSKGISLARDFRALISHDLPLHMNKIIQVVIQAFDDILKQDNSLYQLKYFSNLNELGSEMMYLTPIKAGEYGKKCCSKKGILLINAFIIILEPLCDDKWLFLQQNVLKQMLEKVSEAIQVNWHYWDYYQLFYFFQRLRSGKVNHKKLYTSTSTSTTSTSGTSTSSQQISSSLKQKLYKAQKLSLECWQNFQTQITNKYWNQFLIRIPKILWQTRDYLQAGPNAQQKKPTILGIDFVFSFQQFLKDIQFRLGKQQLQFLLVRFYQYAMYVIQYVVYYQYHSKGTKDKVFSLYKRSQKIYKKAKNFSIEQLQQIKQKKITTINIFTKTGILNLALDLYYFTQAIRVMSDYQKLSAEQYIQKFAQIQAKEHKSQVIGTGKQKFSEFVNGCIKVYKEEPQKIRQYMEKKRKQLGKNKL